MGINLIGREQVDGFTGAQRNVTNDHNYIHRGLGHKLSYSTGAIIPGANYDIGFTTPTAKQGYVHWRPVFMGSSADLASMELYEGATYGSPTGTLIPINCNRNSSRVSNSLIEDNVTTSDAGFFLVRRTSGSAGGPTSRSGSSGGGENEEIVFKPETSYLLRFTNLGSVNTTVRFTLFWYEETYVNG